GTYRARPSPQGREWVKNHWFRPQSIVDRIRVVQESTVRRGKGEAIICAVLGASLTAAIEDRRQKLCQDNTVVDSLERTLASLREQLKETKQVLEEERTQNSVLKNALRDELWKESDSSPQGGLQKAEGTVGNLPHMHPVVKTEYLHDADDDHPQIVTKEVPFTETELKKDFARSPEESETAYWAVGLNPVERGEPLATTGTVDQLVESVQKAACLQMMYDRELKPNQGSPMVMPVDPERTTPLTRV
ncbi:uncharacterized protein LOC122154144, partial [Tyto alba]|uniref:uncharacterized protein LOC122154140 n=1 Tax=Tyto alba TaxID=56313 RepID=UPI001C66B53D